jgi:acetylornithine deacetylase/succinyl-diaminopimelate desuccinylase-like protein
VSPQEEGRRPTRSSPDIWWSVVTDARYYSGLTRNVFRFLPLRLTSRDLERMHGIDERIGIREYEAAIRIYHQLVFEATRS